MALLVCASAAAAEAHASSQQLPEGLGRSTRVAARAHAAPTRVLKQILTLRRQLRAQSAVAPVSYPDMGISYQETPGASLAGAPPQAASAQAALANFREQGVPASVLGSLVASQSPTVELAEVTDQTPQTSNVTAGVPYLAWVVTYADVPAVSYGPSAAPAGATEHFVGIMAVSTGTWTEFFSANP
ncbi:MAG TPA: hypothetical protein VFI30_04885 [Nocardioidaceae bacterium]|nr:hypothetical protein [Nocardioidaceae bacterium]